MASPGEQVTDSGGHDDVSDDVEMVTNLIDDFRHENLQIRVNAFSHLDLIASMLGPERTREELIPYLMEFMDEDDEVLLSVAQGIAGLVQYVGGVKYAHVLFPLLEAMSAVFESVVREIALEAMAQITSIMSPEQVKKHVVPLVQRLCGSSWYTSRVSAAPLCPHVITLLDGDSESQGEVLSCFFSLAEDPTPSVRRAACQAIAELVRVLPWDIVQVKLFGLVSGMLGDEQDAVRIECVLATVQIARAMTEHVLAQKKNNSERKSGDGSRGKHVERDHSDVLRLLEALVEDKSWRTRYNIADKFKKVLTSVIPSLYVEGLEAGWSPEVEASEDLVNLRKRKAARQGFAFKATEQSEKFSTISRSAQGDYSHTLKTLGVEPLKGEEKESKKVAATFLCDGDNDSWVKLGPGPIERKWSDSELGYATSLAHMYAHMLNDNEAEVRTAAAFRLGDVGPLLGSELMVRIVLPAVEKLIEDEAHYVRSAIAYTLMSMACVLNKKMVIGSIIPMFLKLLKDSNPEVRLNVIAKLHCLASVVDVVLLSEALLPAVCELGSDSEDWRVRLSIIAHVPALAVEFGPNHFSSLLFNLCMDWLGDPVFAVREAAAVNLTKLAQVFGIKWAQRNLVPKVAILADHKSYIYRLTALLAIKGMSVVLGRDVTTKHFLPVLLELSSDPVPNIRFNVCKTISVVYPYVGKQELNDYVLPLLKYLQGKDKDEDVKYFSKTTLDTVEEYLNTFLESNENTK